MDIQALKAIVDKATPGPWVVDEEYTDYGAKVRIVRNDKYDYVVSENGVDKSTADYLATFNPSLVSKLLRVVEAAQALSTAYPLGFRAAMIELDAALRDLEQS